MVITIYDLLLTPLYLLLIFFVSQKIQKRNIHKQPLYKYYTKGLFVKIIGAIGVCLVYQYYYEGGDTVSYFETARPIGNLLWKDLFLFVDVMFGDNSFENFTQFDFNTGIPRGYWFEEKSFFVSRLIAPFCIVAFNSFVISAILLAWVCYSGVWLLFLVFNEHFPAIQKEIAIAILFIPSVFFWGSGLLKDTITLSAVGWYTYHFYRFFIQKRYQLHSSIYIFISSFLLISIKPYIFFALIPGSIVWLSNDRLVNVKNKLIRFILAPVFIAMGIALGIFILGQMGDFLGVYAIDKVLDKAYESNMDQKQEYYGGNSFDIGEFKPTIPGVLSKAHLAITATLFRPFLWEAKNPVMFLSALENAYILLLTALLLMRLKVIRFFTLIGDNPLLLFSMLFALFFAFSVGLATSNFGSLVRLKIPCIPFFVCSLFVIRHLYEKKSKRKLGI